LTELSQQLPASIDQAARWTGRPSRAPAFPELVYAHFAWWKATQAGEDSTSAAATYGDVSDRFEERHGQIVDSYWCSHVESAVALTERRRAFSLASPELRFHRETDWATKSYPDIAGELHRCDEIAVRAQNVLTGVRRRVCLKLVMSSAGHLLSLVDARAGHEDEAKTELALGQERAALDATESYYCESANGQAQVVYFAGMATVTAILSILAGVFLAIDWASPLAALLAGAVGAVVSVVQRINAGHFDLQYDVGRPYAFFLGGLRPLIGAAFAVVISFAFTGGLLHLPLAPNDPDRHRRLALMVISFFAGFSERWAQDTLATALPLGSQPPPASARSEPSSTAQRPSE